jgi:hypothetical protein
MPWKHREVAIPSFGASYLRLGLQRSQGECRPGLSRGLKRRTDLWFKGMKRRSFVPDHGAVTGGIVRPVAGRTALSAFDEVPELQEWNTSWIEAQRRSPKLTDADLPAIHYFLEP